MWVGWLGEFGEKPMPILPGAFQLPVYSNSSFRFKHGLILLFATVGWIAGSPFFN